MAPTAPTPPLQYSVPKLHLQILDLSHPGARLFLREINDVHDTVHDFCKQVLDRLYPTAKLPPPPSIRSVTVHIRDFPGVAHTMSSHLDTEHKELHLSASYIASLDERFGGNSREIEHEIKGVLLHELVHVFQYDAKGTIPGGLMEGIADWVRLKGGLGAGHWQEDPRGRDWDAGYETTAYFLEYLDSRNTPEATVSLVARINALCKDTEWDDDWLNECHERKDVHGAWVEYKDDWVKRREKEFSDKTEPAPPIPTHV